MGPFPPSVAWLVRSFHCFTVPLRAAFLSHSYDGFQIFVPAKGKAQSGFKCEHKGAFYKHIDKNLSSAKGY